MTMNATSLTSYTQGLSPYINRTCYDCTFSVFGKRNCDTVGSFVWRETNKDDGIFQHEGVEPVGDWAEVTGTIVEIGDKQRCQQAGHHQGKTEGEENICGEAEKAHKLEFHLQTERHKHFFHSEAPPCFPIASAKDENTDYPERNMWFWKIRQPTSTYGST